MKAVSARSSRIRLPSKLVRQLSDSSSLRKETVVYRNLLIQCCNPDCIFELHFSGTPGSERAKASSQRKSQKWFTKAKVPVQLLDRSKLQYQFLTDRPREKLVLLLHVCIFHNFSVVLRIHSCNNQLHDYVSLVPNRTFRLDVIQWGG